MYLFILFVCLLDLWPIIGSDAYMNTESLVMLWFLYYKCTCISGQATCSLSPEVIVTQQKHKLLLYWECLDFKAPFGEDVKQTSLGVFHTISPFVISPGKLPSFVWLDLVIWILTVTYYSKVGQLQDLVWNASDSHNRQIMLFWTHVTSTWKPQLCWWYLRR